MMLEGSVAEDLSQMQNRQQICPIPLSYEYSVPQGKDDSRIYFLIDIQPINEW